MKRALVMLPLSAVSCDSMSTAVDRLTRCCDRIFDSKPYGSSIAQCSTLNDSTSTETTEETKTDYAHNLSVSQCPSLKGLFIGLGRGMNCLPDQPQHVCR